MKHASAARRWSGRRTLTSILTLLLAAAVIGLGPGTAAAGDGYYSADDCRPDVEWNKPGPQWAVYYRSGYGTYVVQGDALSTYADYGYQCGVLGPPSSDVIYQERGGEDDFEIQYFEGGNLWWTVWDGRVNVTIYGPCCDW